MPAYRFCANGRKRRISNIMMPYIVQHMLRQACHMTIFPLFWCFRVDGRKQFEYAKEFYVNTVRWNNPTVPDMEKHWNLWVFSFPVSFWCLSHCCVAVAGIWSSIRPIIFHLRSLNSLLRGSMSALSSGSSVLTWHCYWICSILRRHLLWNTSTALSSPTSIFHVSHPRRTGTSRF